MATKLKDVFGQILGKRGEAVRELNVSMRAKGNMTQRQDTMLRACSIFTNMSYTVATSLVGFTTSFAAAHVHKIVGGQPVPRLLRLGVSAGAGLIAGQMVYYRSLHTCTLYLLNKGDERLKTELSTIILTKHSDEKSSVEAVRRHFYAEELYTDQHKLEFRWIPRNMYIDGTYVERQETEANNSADKAKTISAETTVKNTSFGNLMEDPLACILGFPDNMENQDDNTPKRTTTILRKRDLRARRRRHRHHHQHATL
ncbi:uncharacterized protein LOC124688357 isoform X1 [Lolium rigidum]|uniref:uncharacterized protein LOC124688357 isoform X1 n=1 Tax=Lolium rigidum TaxID=89674 RepID=UPI001F5DE646|nr:uncharacterized protein LOC124688357 isoform X1 [Lolium rigidum]